MKKVLFILFLLLIGCSEYQIPDQACIRTGAITINNNTMLPATFEISNGPCPEECEDCKTPDEILKELRG